MDSRKEILMDAGVDQNELTILRDAVGEDLSVMVGIPCNEKFVNTEFTFSFPQLVMPNCRVGFYISGKDTVFDMREDIANKALQGEFTHLIMLDVDMVYPPLTLLRLLATGRDVINAFSVTRTMPHDPIFSRWADNGEFLGDGGKAYVRTWPTDTNTPEGTPLQGAIRTNVVGGAAMCMKTDVLKKLLEEDPYKPFFAWMDGMGEDVYFSRRCTEAGFELYTMVDLIIKHIATFSVIPSYNYEMKTWGVIYDNSPQTEQSHQQQLMEKKALVDAKKQETNDKTSETFEDKLAELIGG